MRILKTIFKIFMIILILLFIGITIFFMTFDLNSYRGMIVQKASEALGRPVTIDNMSMKVSLIPTVAVKGVKIDNPEGFDTKAPFVQIDSMDVTLALIPLLSGNIELKDFTMNTATVGLIDQKGQNNWTFNTADSTKPVAPKPTVQKTSGNDNILNKLHIDNIAIKKLSVSYAQDDKTQAVSLLNVSVKQLKLISLTLVYEGKTVKLSGNLGDIAGLVSQKPNYAFSLTVDAFDATAKIKGTIGDTAKFKKMVFNVTANGKNLRNTVAYAASSMPQIPSLPFAIDTTIKGDLDGDLKIEPFKFTLDDTKAVLTSVVTIKDLQKSLKVLAKGDLTIEDQSVMSGFGLKPLAVQFDLDADPKNIAINSLNVGANKSDIALNGTISLADKVPNIIAKVSSEYLDYQDFMIESDQAPARGTSSPSKKSSGLFSDDKIDLSALKLVDAAVTVAAKNIKVPEFDYIGLNTAVNLKNGDLNIPSLAVRTMAGNISGNANINAANMPAKVAIKLDAPQMRLNAFKPILEHLKDSVVSAQLNVTTQGDSLKSFVSHLNGQIVAEVSEGVIVNKWFNSLPVAMGMIKNKTNAMSFSSSDQVSTLECGVLNLHVKNGVITSNNQIAIETSVVNFAVSGEINLPNESLSLTMVPSLSDAKNATQNALALTQIVKISGPFTNLKPSLDTQKIAQGAVKAGLNVLADKLAKKEGLSLPGQSDSGAATYNLCEKALGRPLKGQTKNRPIPQIQSQTTTPQTTVKPVEKMTPKEEFKQQFLNSLSEALKKK